MLLAKKIKGRFLALASLRHKLDHCRAESSAKNTRDRVLAEIQAIRSEFTPAQMEEANYGDASWLKDPPSVAEVLAPAPSDDEEEADDLLKKYPRGNKSAPHDDRIKYLKAKNQMEKTLMRLQMTSGHLADADKATFFSAVGLVMAFRQKFCCDSDSEEDDLPTLRQLDPYLTDTEHEGELGEQLKLAGYKATSKPAKKRKHGEKHKADEEEKAGGIGGSASSHSSHTKKQKKASAAQGNQERRNSTDSDASAASSVLAGLSKTTKTIDVGSDATMLMTSSAHQTSTALKKERTSQKTRQCSCPRACAQQSIC